MIFADNHQSPGRQAQVHSPDPRCPAVSASPPTIAGIEYMFDHGLQADPAAERSAARQMPKGEGEESCVNGADLTDRSARRRRAVVPPKQPGRGAGGLPRLGVLMPTLLEPGHRFTGTAPTDVGSLTHLLIATHAAAASAPAISAEDGSCSGPAVSLESLYAIGYAAVEANPNRTQVIVTQAASLAYRYLTAYLPQGWVLLGGEYDCGPRGRVDVAWQHPDREVVIFDEVKTSRVRTTTPPPTWLTQTRRYTAAGVARFGLRFAGTRLLPLQNMGLAWLVGDGLPVTRIRPTAADPFAAPASGGLGLGGRS